LTQNFPTFDFRSETILFDNNCDFSGGAAIPPVPQIVPKMRGAAPPTVKYGQRDIVNNQKNEYTGNLFF
jgi:hypothetical protein